VAKDHKRPKNPATTKPRTPNYHLVGDAYGAPTTIETLLRFARVEPRGRNRWYVEARPLEWVVAPGHTVWFTPGGLLQCDCRQGVAGRACDHVVAVRQIGTIKPSRAADPRQMRLVDDTATAVRIETPRGRYRAEYHVVEMWRTRPRPLSASERVNG